MSDVDPEVLDRLNKLAEQRFTLQVQLDGQNATFKANQVAATARHNAQIAPMQAEIDALDAQLVKLVQTHRAKLIKPKRKSFATMIATFQFRDVTTKLKVVDVDGLMAAARKLGIVRKIACQVVLWKLDRDKLAAWLEKHGEYIEDLIDFIEGPSDGESLTIKPNGTHTVVYDGDRISPPSVTIKKS